MRQVDGVSQTMEQQSKDAAVLNGGAQYEIRSQARSSNLSSARSKLPYPSRHCLSKHGMLIIEHSSDLSSV